MITAPVNATDDILVRLRNETRPEHDAIEAALDLMTPGLSRTVYGQQLARFYGFYQPLENSLARLVNWSEFGLDFHLRRKTALLADDLNYLGIDAGATLPVCLTLPPLTSVAAGFGCAYVLEGATLGGQLISWHVTHTLGLNGLQGARFFNCYGDRTGMMWKAFRAALVGFAVSPAAKNEVVASAIATFDSLRCWCLAGKPA